MAVDPSAEPIRPERQLEHPSTAFSFGRDLPMKRGATNERLYSMHNLDNLARSTSPYRRDRVVAREPNDREQRLLELDRRVGRVELIGRALAAAIEAPSALAEIAAAEEAQAAERAELDVIRERFTGH
jgi:hypothetical protein